MKRDDIPKIGKVMTMGKSIKITSGLLLIGMLGILCACQSKDIESMKTATTISEGEIHINKQRQQSIQKHQKRRKRHTKKAAYLQQ